MKYQKLLPILSENNDTYGFSVNARILHEQIKVKKKFATWVKSNLKDYIENIDYIISFLRETDAKTPMFAKDFDYYLTVNLAKKIAITTETILSCGLRIIGRLCVIAQSSFCLENMYMRSDG